MDSIVIIGLAVCLIAFVGLGVIVRCLIRWWREDEELENIINKDK